MSGSSVTGPESASGAPPQADSEKLALGLALSGGGLRAMLFHLGVVKYLRDVKLLQKVTSITSVSGGSILGAHLVLYWEDYLGDKFDERAKELIDFAQHDLRGRITRSAYSVERLFTFRKGSPTSQLAQFYSKELFDGKKLSVLGEGVKDGKRPLLSIVATDLESGTASYFTHEGLWYPPAGDKPAAVGDQEIALAVAASSAFPVLFSPVVLTPRRVGRRREEFFNLQRLLLTDGGVYDNLGLHPFRAGSGSPRLVLVSDASQVPGWATFRGPWLPGNYIKGLQRSYDIAASRLHQLDSQSLAVRHADGPLAWVHLPIHKAIGDVPPAPGSSQPGTHPLGVEEQLRLKDIRTDFDKFPGVIIRALVIHGQWVARDVLSRLPAVKGTFDPADWRQYDPRPREGASDPLRVSPEDYDAAQRRRWGVFAADRPSVVNAAAGLLLIAVVVSWWYLSRPFPPREVSIDVANAAKFESTDDSQFRWLNDYQDASFKAGVRDKDAGVISEVQLVLLPTVPFESRTLPFQMRVVPGASKTLSFQAFRVRPNDQGSSFVPLAVSHAYPDEPDVLVVQVPLCEPGDYILFAGQVRATKGTLPEQVRQVAAFVKVEVP